MSNRNFVLMNSSPNSKGMGASLSSLTNLNSFKSPELQNILKNMSDPSRGSLVGRSNENFDDIQSKLFVSIHSNVNPNNINSKRISIEDLINYIKENINIINNPYLSRENEQEPEVLAESQLNHMYFSPLQPNAVKQIFKFPTNLNNIFKGYISDICRIGVMKYNLVNKDYKYNISLLSSVLSCLKDDFILQPSQTQQLYVSQLNNNLVSFVNSDKYIDFSYKRMGFKQNEMISQIKNYQNTKIILRVIADYFQINIFLLNITIDQLMIASEFNQFKKSILISLLDGDSFEPIFYKNIKNLDGNIDLIKYLYETKCYQKLIDCPELEPENELDKYLNKRSHKGYSVCERQLLRLLENEKTKGEQELVIDKKVEHPMENDVEGVNEIIECSEASDRFIPDLSESDDEVADKDFNISDYLKENNKNKINNKSDYNNDIEDTTDMMPELLANNEKLKDSGKYLLEHIKNKLSYDERKRKLDDLQEDARLLGIPLTVIGKNGKPKNKTKRDLIVNIQELLEKKEKNIP